MKNHIRGLTALLVVSALLPVACGTQKKAATYRQEDSSLQEVLQVQTEQVAKAVTDSVQYRFQSLQAGDDGIEGDIHRADSDESGAGDDTDAEPP